VVHIYNPSNSGDGDRWITNLNQSGKLSGTLSENKVKKELGIAK
jgi:hypothetical protein